MSVLEDLRWKQFHVLDQGSVFLVDVMGDDAAICQAARVSYGGGTKSVSDDRTLIRYLMRHRHTSPFEQCELKFVVSCPMDVWRQWIRTRTASVNEYSTRYSEAIAYCQKTPPGQWRLQSSINKQGSSVEFLRENGESGDEMPSGCILSDREDKLHELSRRVYEERLSAGVAREQARKDLPLSNYTEAYWKIDLHNLFHFLGLRMDSHAQQEIREYATIIGHEIVKPLFPMAWQAFEDYRLSAMSLTRLDIEVINATGMGVAASDALAGITNTRERQECEQKLARLGLPAREVSP